LSINKKLKTFKVHRLVAEAFILNDNNNPQVNHIDGNKQNNKINNLEWVTNKDNIVHAYKNGLITPANGETHHNSKLTVKIINEAYKLKNDGLSYALIAKKFNVNKSTIMRALKGETWRK